MNCFAISFFHLIYQTSITGLYIYFKWLHSFFGNPLQRSCLENPRDGGARLAAVYGAARSWTRLKQLSSSSSSSNILLHSYINTFLINALQQQTQVFVLLLCYYKQCFSERHFEHVLFCLSMAIFF